MARRRRSDDDRPATPSRWWLCTGETLTSALWGWVDALASRRRADNLMDQIHEAIYEGRPLGTAQDYPALEHLRRQRSAPASLNLARSMVDTVVSRLGKRRPMPVISADDAGWTEKLFAKRASRVLRRKMGQPFVERIMPVILRDALIRGTGVIHSFRDGGDVCIERVPRYEMVVDPRDGRHGCPRVIARVKTINRDVLAEMFPDHAAAIRNASATDTDTWSPHDYESTLQPDELEVVEAHHLPSGPGATDGKHVICVRGIEPLVCEPWKRQRFPYAFLHWSPPTRGFWGHGLVEDLTGIQAKTNDMLVDAQVAAAFAGKLKLFQARAANINKNHMRANGTVVIETDGPPPTFVDATPMVQHQLQIIDWLIQRAYEMTGVSQAGAASKNPLGSNASGKALDTMYDIESDRFSNPELNYAMARVDIGGCVLDEARDIADDGDMKAAEKAPWIREIKWAKIDVDGGDYHLNLEPQNFLPDSRAGRLSAVGEMAKAGLLQDQMQTLALFDEPDLNRYNRYRLGPYYNLERIMEGLADESVPIEELVPDPQVLAAAPELAKQMALGEYNYAQSEEAPEAVLERYRWFLDMLKSAEEQTAMPAVPPGMPGPLDGAVPPGPMGPAGPMGPPGMPMPPAVAPMPMGVAA